MKIISISVVLAAAVILSCGDNAVNPIFLIDAPSRIAIDGNTLEMAAGLHRDFMPSVPPAGHPLNAVAELYDINSLSIPEQVTVDSLWVLDYPRIWAARFLQHWRSPDNDTLYSTNNDGPKWEPGTTADIIIKINYLGNEYFLKAENVVITVSY